jgi:hypothetical protein
MRYLGWRLIAAVFVCFFTATFIWPQDFLPPLWEDRAVPAAAAIIAWFAGPVIAAVDRWERRR